MKRRKIVVLSCVVFLFIGAFAAFEYSKSRGNVVKVLVSTPQLQSVEVGDYPTLNDGQKLAIQELSRQLKIHPKTSNFKVSWITPSKISDKSTVAFFLSNNMKSQLLSWNFSFPPGSSLTWRYPFYVKNITFGGRNSLYVDPVFSPLKIHRAARLKQAPLGEMRDRGLYGTGYDYRDSK